MEPNLSNGRKWIILIITSVSTFMSTLDASIVNIALPVMSARMKVSISAIQWVVTSYLLAITVLLLIWGKLSDLYGKRNIFACGFIVFAVGSLLCSVSQSLTMLVVSRVIQAVGASSMMSLSQGIVTGVFSSAERGRALGFVGTMVALGNLVGPSLGGILVHAFGWSSIFLINVPIGIVGSVLAFLIIPEIFEKEKNKAFDFKGSALFTAFVLLLFLGLLFVQQGTLSSVWILPTLAVSGGVLAWFLVTEKRCPAPLVDLKLFRAPQFSMGLAAAYLSFIAINSTLLFIPFYLQDLLHFSALKAGLVISIYPITMAIVAPISGWLSDKITYRPLTVAGMAVASAALFMLTGLSERTPTSWLLALLCMLGGGIAVFQSPNNSSIMGSVPRAKLGVAGGTNALFRNLGFVSGTTFSVLIFSFSTHMSINSLTGSFDRKAFVHGLALIFLFDALCCTAAALLNLTRAVGIRGSAPGAPAAGDTRGRETDDAP